MAWTWEYPAIIVGFFILSLWVGVRIIRTGSGKGGAQHTFDCDVCGRWERAPSAKQWRYCPYCGNPVRVPKRHALVDLPLD